VNFLIDTNICSAYLKGNRSVWNRFTQYSGGLAISVVSAGEMWTWVERGKTSERARKAVTEFIDLIEEIDVDLEVALRFGELRAVMMDGGKPIPDMDGLIATTALSHDLTLVTNNVFDFQNVPDLRLQNWMED